MDREIKKKWVAALRSGKYKQGFRQLRARRSHEDDQLFHCCLGVLAELYCEATNQPWNPEEVNNVEALAEPVLNWAGLIPGMSLGGIVRIGVTLTQLSFHNDAGKTFEQIADAIDEQM